MVGDRVSRRALLRTSGLALAATVAGCVGGSTPAEQTVTMTGDMRFDPGNVTVAKGGTVTWTNAGQVEHTVTAIEEEIPTDAAYFASGGFESEQAAQKHMRDGLLDPDESYSHTFEVPGTYEYYCIPHESGGMDGTVRVK